MVTLQILVLSFQVRILVAQPRGLLKKRSFFLFYIFSDEWSRWYRWYKYYRGYRKIHRIKTESVFTTSYYSIFCE